NTGLGELVTNRVHGTRVKPGMTMVGRVAAVPAFQLSAAEFRSLFAQRAQRYAEKRREAVAIDDPPLTRPRRNLCASLRLSASSARTHFPLISSRQAWEPACPWSGWSGGRRGSGRSGRGGAAGRSFAHARPRPPWSRTGPSSGRR